MSDERNDAKLRQEIAQAWAEHVHWRGTGAHVDNFDAFSYGYREGKRVSGEPVAREIAALRSAAKRADRAEKVLRRIADMFGNEDRTNRECCEPAFRYFNPIDAAREEKP